MTIQQCRYVMEIARTSSFSEAAKQLFVAQSSLSAGVKALEGELGIRIFERSPNGVYLTADGAEFLRYAADIVATDGLVARRYTAPEQRERLFIATQHYDFVADLFAGFVKASELSRYRFALREIETHNVIREVQTSYSDVGIIAIKGGDYDIMKRYLDKRNLTFTPFLEASPHVFLREGHPLADSTRLVPGDLKDFPYVTYAQGEMSSSFFTEELSDPLGTDKHIEISDRATLMNLLLTTDAYTVGTGIMPSALNRGDILCIPFDCRTHYVIGYLLNAQRKLSPMAEKFLAHLEAAAKEISQAAGKEGSYHYESTC